MQTVISKDGTKLAYDKFGQGPALILVGGAFSYRKFPELMKLANLLSDRYTVYNYDRRGRGDSGDTDHYETQREVEDLQAMIDEAGGSSYVWGLSSGGVLVLQAADSGLKITKMAIHEPPFVVDVGDRKPPKDFLKHLRELTTKNQRAEAIKYFMTKGMGVPSFVVGMMRFMPGVWKSLMSIAHTLPYDAALMDGYMDGKPLLANKWNNVTMSTLVIEGSESPTSLRIGAQALANALSNAQLISKKGLGHTKKLNTKMIAAELMGFFGSDHSN